MATLSRLAPLILAMAAMAAQPCWAQRTKDGVTELRLSGGGGPMGQVAVGDFQVGHIDGFTGAKKVAIAVFNVAFPDANALTANMRKETLAMSFRASSTTRTTLTGIDAATRQRIADAAYADFLAALKAGGYEVVESKDLARLAPEYATWTTMPNETKGRYGSYVAPTGQSVKFLVADAAKRDTSGRFGQMAPSFRGFDRPQAFTRSPYVAHDANVPVIAVTLVVDYGVYTSSGESGKVKAGAVTGFNPGVTAQAGTLFDTGTMLEYWGTNSGGFPTVAALHVPVQSDKPFAQISNETTKGVDQDITVRADPAAYEAAAKDVVATATAKLVDAMTAR
jgi:hypothetical protein